MLKVNRDPAVHISTMLTLELYLQHQLSEAETLALMKYLRRKLPVTTLSVREEQHLSASWPVKP